LGSCEREDTGFKMINFWSLLLVGLVSGLEMPDGPQGPPGAILKYDLLSNSQPGINYPGGHLGAFVPQQWPAGVVNNELQEYVPEAAVQDPTTGEITITAKKEGGRITSARLESYGVWTTAQSADIKNRGYVEVRSTLPAKPNGGTLKGSWPAIWMLGTGNGNEWPRHGEIDIVEAVNGDPTIVMSLHSTNHYGGGPQHPDKNPLHMNADLTTDHLIAGFEWNKRDDAGQLDLTWWFTWFDQGSQSWVSDHTTKVLSRDGNNDYMDFWDSFNGEGFSLLINLAEGGAMPQTDDVFVDGQPQYMNIKSVKVYGF